MTLVFIDAEFTGEHAYTTLVSLGLVTSSGDELELALDDYDETQVTEWLRENVLARIDPASRMPSAEAYRRLDSWLSRHAGEGVIHLVSAGLGSDRLLLYELYRHANPTSEQFHALHCLPAYLNHAQHFDLNTLLYLAGYDPNADRESLVEHRPPGRRHDALFDARLARELFRQISRHPALQAMRTLLT